MNWDFVYLFSCVKKSFSAKKYESKSSLNNRSGRDSLSWRFKWCLGQQLKELQAKGLATKKIILTSYPAKRLDRFWVVLVTSSTNCKSNQRKELNKLSHYNRIYSGHMSIITTNSKLAVAQIKNNYKSIAWDKSLRRPWNLFWHHWFYISDFA